MIADSLVMQGPTHQWFAVATLRGSGLQKRYCPVCRLCDSRDGNLPHPNENHGWKVQTPCIAPMPETIDAEDFRMKLIEHGVTHRPVIKQTAMGNIIGFKMEDDSIHPQLRVDSRQSIEHAYARLLRWVKARYYDVKRYSDPSFDEEIVLTGMAKAG